MEIQRHKSELDELIGLGDIGEKMKRRAKEQSIHEPIVQAQRQESHDRAADLDSKVSGCMHLRIERSCEVGHKLKPHAAKKRK